MMLDQTDRMHPDLYRYTSEIFYDEKLRGVAGLDRQAILGDAPLSGSGLRIVEVVHQGSTNASPAEADEVARLAVCSQGLCRAWEEREA